MNKMKVILGSLIMALPFIVLFILASLDMGIFLAIMVFVAIALICLLFWYSINLIMDGMEGKE